MESLAARLRSILILFVLVSELCLLITCKQQPEETGKRVHKPAGRYVLQDSKTNKTHVDLYAATGIGALSRAAASARWLVYVPNSKSDTVTVIDPVTRTVLRTFPTGKLPQHVVPSYDMSVLWVTNNKGNSLTRIDPVTGKDSIRVPVDDPYNLYFTPDGKAALVVAEGHNRLDFRDPVTMKLLKPLEVKCRGLDHLDFLSDDKYAIATCEFSGELVKIDLIKREPIAYLHLRGYSMPQDIRSAPDGLVFFVADMKENGVHLIDPARFREIGFIKTGKGTHGIAVGRGGKFFYIMNRGWNQIYGGRHGPGSITVLDPESRKIVATWHIPGGGSPDMGNVTADGKELWVSGRYDYEVYDIDIVTGHLIARIPVGAEPHGLCVWPQPGRFSTGHTGNMR
jgi:YVTN family beta-propeller protein